MKCRKQLGIRVICFVCQKPKIKLGQLPRKATVDVVQADQNHNSVVFGLKNQVGGLASALQVFEVKDNPSVVAPVRMTSLLKRQFVGFGRECRSHRIETVEKKRHGI